MSAISIERTARKRHMCARCRRDIRPGEHYLECKFAPGDNDIGNEHWWCERVHLTYEDCQSRPCEIRCAIPYMSPFPCNICEASS